MASAQSCVILAISKTIAEVVPSADHLLGRTATYSQLQARTSDKVRSTSVLRHVEGILVPHVNDPSPNLNLPRPSSDGGEQRERRCQLSSEVMNSEVSSIHPKAFGLDSEVN
jgi:hypothetical protein